MLNSFTCCKLGTSRSSSTYYAKGEHQLALYKAFVDYVPRTTSMHDNVSLRAGSEEVPMFGC